MDNINKNNPENESRKPAQHNEQTISNTDQNQKPHGGAFNEQSAQKNQRSDKNSIFDTEDRNAGRDEEIL